MTTSEANSAAGLQATQIRELLVVGYRPERVAKKLGLPLAHVLAAKAIPDEAASPDPDEAARRTLLLVYKIVREEALEAWEESKEQGEETVTISGTEDGESKKVSRKIRKQSGDVRYLDRVTRTAALEGRLRQIDKPSKGAQGSSTKQTAGIKTNGQDTLDKAIIAEQRSLFRFFMDNPGLYNRWLVDYFPEDLERVYKENASPLDPANKASPLSELGGKDATPSSAAAPPPAAAAPTPRRADASTLAQSSPAEAVETPRRADASTLADVDDEDEDEDKYLADRYGDDAVELLRPTTPERGSSAKRAIPGPAPEVGGPKRRTQVDDTS